MLRIRILQETDHISFFANYHSPEMHSHFAKHLIFSQGGEFDCVVNEKLFRCSGVCIASMVEHTIVSDIDHIFVMLIEETSEFAATLERLILKGKPYAIISDHVFADDRSLSIAEADAIVLSAYNSSSPQNAFYDERISEALCAIEYRECIDENIISDLYNAAYLSQSRFSHLFRQQVGIPLASYLVMAKMRKVLDYTQMGENLTEASIHAGFSSSAHFASTCKKMFGLSFSDFKR